MFSTVWQLTEWNNEETHKSQLIVFINTKTNRKQTIKIKPWKYYHPKISLT